MRKTLTDMLKKSVLAVGLIGALSSAGCSPSGYDRNGNLEPALNIFTGIGLKGMAPGVRTPQGFAGTNAAGDAMIQYGVAQSGRSEQNVVVNGNGSNEERRYWEDLHPEKGSHYKGNTVKVNSRWVPDDDNGYLKKANGTEYYGEFRHGEFVKGEGKFVIADTETGKGFAGLIYEGGIAKNMSKLVAQGRAKIKKEGSFTYRINFDDDLPVGESTVTFEDGKSCSGKVAGHGTTADPFKFVPVESDKEIYEIEMQKYGENR